MCYIQNVIGVISYQLMHNKVFELGKSQKKCMTWPTTHTITLNTCLEYLSYSVQHTFHNIVIKLGPEMSLCKTSNRKWELCHFPSLLKSHHRKISPFWTWPIYLKLQSKHIYIGGQSNLCRSIMRGDG